MKPYRISILPRSRGEVWRVKDAQGNVLSAGTSPADAWARMSDCRRAQAVAQRRYA